MPAESLGECVRADGQGRDFSQGWALGQEQDNVQLWVQLHQGHQAPAMTSGWLEGWGTAADGRCLGTQPLQSVRKKSENSLGGIFLSKRRERLKGR